MSEMERENLWMAALDGEQTAGEALSFDASLTSQERERLHQEKQLERSLCDCLAGCECCPDLMWKRVETALRGRGADTRRWRSGWTVGLAAAAALLLVIAYSFVRGVTSDDFTVMAASTIDQLETQCCREVPGDEQNVDAFLADRGIPLEIRDLGNWNKSHHHSVNLLGIHECTYREEPVIEILFACCGQPAKVVLVRADGVAAAKLRDAAHEPGSHVRVARVLGDRLAGVVSRHRAEEFLGNFRVAGE